MDEFKREEALLTVREIKKALENLQAKLMKVEFLLSYHPFDYDYNNPYNIRYNPDDYSETRYDPGCYCDEADDDRSFCYCDDCQEY